MRTPSIRIDHRPLIILLICFLPWGAASAQESPAKDAERRFQPRFDPVQEKIECWTVHIEPSLKKNPEGRQALRMLADHLHRISILVPKAPLERMRRLEIWIEEDHPRLKSMQYHPSQSWLRANKHDPRLTRKVHIPVARQLLSRSQLLKHPAVILLLAYLMTVIGLNLAGLFSVSGGGKWVHACAARSVRHRWRRDHGAP